MLIAYFRTVPKEMEEVALIDGFCRNDGIDGYRFIDSTLDSCHFPPDVAKVSLTYWKTTGLYGHYQGYKSPQ
jgi:hypothetical protein